MTSMQPDLTYPADIVSKPERAIADYLVSRKIRSEIVKKLPDWDIACDSPDANLVVAKRDLVEAKCVLNSEKTIYDAKTKEINEKWNDLRLKQYELRDAFERNNKVLKTNYKERKKSEKQISEEESEEKRVQLDINDLVKQLQYYQAAEAKLTESIEGLKMYEDFLQKVVAEYPEFNCIDDILNRYESLIETREEMRDLQIDSINQVEKIRQEVEEFTEERLLDLYNLNQSLSQLRLKKYFVQSELTHWAQAIEKLRDMGIKDYIEIMKAVEGIWLLYLNMCAARKEKPELDKTQLRVLCNLESQEKTNGLQLNNNNLEHSSSRVRRQNPMDQGKQAIDEKMKEFAEKGKSMMGGGFPQGGPMPPSFMQQGFHP